MLYNAAELNDSWADDWLASEYAPFLNAHNVILFVMVMSLLMVIIPPLKACACGEAGNSDGGTLAINDSSCAEPLSAEDSELIEDQVAAEWNIDMTSNPMANVLQFEHIENEISVADLGGGGGHGPDQQPKFLIEITILGTIFEKFSASLHSASN